MPFRTRHTDALQAFPLTSANFIKNGGNGGNKLTHEQIRERVKKGIPPATAEEYLLRVRLEAEDYPDVTIGATLQKKGSKVQEKTNVNSNNTKQRSRRNEQLVAWERQVVSIFRQGRQYIDRVYHHEQMANKDNGEWRNRLPALNDGYGWEYLCFGTTTQANRNVMAKLEKEEREIDYGNNSKKEKSLQNKEEHSATTTGIL